MSAIAVSKNRRPIVSRDLAISLVVLFFLRFNRLVFAVDRRQDSPGILAVQVNQGSSRVAVSVHEREVRNSGIGFIANLGEVLRLLWCDLHMRALGLI